MRKEKSLGTDELSCLAKYLISHLALQVKIDSLNSNINIHEKNGIMFHLERIFGGDAIFSNASWLSEVQHAGIGVLFNTDGNLQLT